ncbi:hypothetical protein ANCCEY_12975 [Ancylostoma ceylanicum]|uniref:C2H2-type domain-containing protein n=1 Tax=Ancylostoma ceylanicum TaxID=53326 RepID=A0A0D6L832_9BILA|nr:hypothetical protein ANCCEY_12975 [Ancylostoma ceylanicum]
MIHSDSKPYQCWDCDFIGIKSNVISHARQTNHRSDDAHDITTDVMRSEWNTMLHQCFPDYVKAKSRGWQASHDDVAAIETDVMRSEWNTMLHQCFPDYVKAKSRGWQASHDDVAAIESPEIKSEDAVVHAIESPEIKSEE